MYNKYGSIMVRISDSVANVSLSSPVNMNAITADVKRELADFFYKARENDRIQAILLTGRERVFFVGSDLQINAHDNVLRAHGNVRRHRNLISLMHDLEKPIIAAVNGFAIGAGKHLALACDIVIASDDAIFCDARLSGDDESKRIGAMEALQAGVISKVVPRDDLIEEARAIAASVSKGQTISMVYVKRLISKQDRKRPTQALQSVQGWADVVRIK